MSFLPTRLPGQTAAYRFLKKEDGAMTILGVFIFVMILMAGGIAIDVMRSEVDRANLQSTVDRITLASASLSEEDQVREVIRNYLEAAGLPEEAIEIETFEADLQGRTVTLSAQSRVDSLFMGLLGAPELTQPILASANQEYSELEVSLVLDISGSMRGSKIESLKTEAVKFVEALLTERSKDLTTVSIVPYNGLVNIGPDLARFMPMTNNHGLSYCVTFPPEHFKTTQIAPDGQPQVMQRMPFFDMETGTGDTPNGNAPGRVPLPHCVQDTRHETDATYNNNRGAVLAWSNDVVELRTMIQNLPTRHWTATDLGAKVGAFLLDPAAQPILEDMVDAGVVEANFLGRPYAWDAPQVNKVLIIMTDGDNTNQYDLKSGRQTGPSGVFVYREPDPDNPDEEPFVLIPDDVYAVDDEGNRIGTCDPSEVTVVDPLNPPADGETPLVLLAHDNCDGLKGRFDATEGANGDPADPWWDAPRIKDVLAKADVDIENQSRLRFSVRTRSSNRSGFYVPHRDEYLDEPYGGEDAYQLSYQELFAAYPLKYISDVMLAGATNATRNHYGNATTTTHNAGTTYRDGETRADWSLLELCKAASADDRMQVFTIAFDVDAGSTAERVMSKCAENGTGQFLRPDGNNLSQAFADILAAIEDLRLTE
ncbi:MAG: VWA domain-containing protein [Pseudomonadota bacterium]